jgi:hypothetical protein
MHVDQLRQIIREAITDVTLGHRRRSTCEGRGHMYSTPRDHVFDSEADISDLIDIMDAMVAEAGSVEDARNHDLTDEAQLLVKRVKRSGWDLNSLIGRDPRFEELFFALGL